MAAGYMYDIKPKSVTVVTVLQLEFRFSHTLKSGLYYIYVYII